MRFEEPRRPILLPLERWRDDVEQRVEPGLWLESPRIKTPAGFVTFDMSLGLGFLIYIMGILKAPVHKVKIH